MQRWQQRQIEETTDVELAANAEETVDAAMAVEVAEAAVA